MKKNLANGIRAALVVALVSIFAIACSTGPSAQGEDPVREAPVVKDEYPAIIERSLRALGNTARFRAVVERARAGEDIMIAAIGGSITEGANASSMNKAWASLAADEFRTRFAPDAADRVRMVHAGMGGTPSTLGMVRQWRDIDAQAGRAPDLVFVEFAVNDWDDMTKGAAYESLVVDLLSRDTKPAVVLVFSVFKSKWNLQDRLIPVGTAYDLPMISIKDAVVPALESGWLTDAKFFSDQYHPTDYGHRLMADCMANWYDAAMAAPLLEEAPLPAEAAIGRQFAGIRMIDAANIPEGVTLEPGAFSAKDSALGTLKYATSRKTFPENWHKSATAASSEPLRMTLNCRNLVMVYKRSSQATFGTAEVFVDGKLVQSPNAVESGGWNNPWTIVLLDNMELAAHTVEVRMAAGSEEKAFSILAFGYTE